MDNSMEDRQAVYTLFWGETVVDQVGKVIVIVAAGKGRAVTRFILSLQLGRRVLPLQYAAADAC